MEISDDVRDLTDVSDPGVDMDLRGGLQAALGDEIDPLRDPTEDMDPLV